MNWDILLLSIFGVLLIATCLGLAIKFPNPTAFQIVVFRTALALSAGGITAAIPGFLHLSLNITGVAIRAGGALAVFILIYRINPARPRPEEKLTAESGFTERAPGGKLALRKITRGLRHDLFDEGFCYLNKDGLDKLFLERSGKPKRQISYQDVVRRLISQLGHEDKISRNPRPGEREFVLITCHFSFYDDDENHLVFRSDQHGFLMSFGKLKSTFWPWESKMSKLAHVRIALQCGVDLTVFGQWYTNYLRPYAAAVAGDNLSDMNTLH